MGGGRSCSGECMGDCLLQLLPRQEHGGKDLLPTDVFFKGETHLEGFSNGQRLEIQL